MVSACAPPKVPTQNKQPQFITEAMGMYPNAPVYEAMYTMYNHTNNCSNLNSYVKMSVQENFPIIQDNLRRSQYAGEAQKIESKIDKLLLDKPMSCEKITSAEMLPSWKVWMNRMEKTSDLIAIRQAKGVY